MEIKQLLEGLLKEGLPEKTFLDLAAIFAAPPTSVQEIESNGRMDALKNPHNEGYGKPVRRGPIEIDCDRRYIFAHEMLKASKRTLNQLHNMPNSGRTQ
jgi:hypothetical protein